MADRDPVFNVELELASGERRKIDVRSTMSITAFKWKVHEVVKVTPKHQHLFLEGLELVDYALGNYGIESSEHNYVIKLHIFYTGLIQPFFLDEKHFDPRWHADFSNAQENRAHYRGGKLYRRPIGSVRFAVKVGGKYSESLEEWLGHKGTTDPEATGWPVAYHGTPELNVLDILRNGFDLRKCRRFAYGVGIYCPDPMMALTYGQEYRWDGKVYKLILQCRVDPKKLKSVAVIDGCEYWTVPDGSYIRPYAVCAYEQSTRAKRDL